MWGGTVALGTALLYLNSIPTGAWHNFCLFYVSINHPLEYDWIIHTLKVQTYAIEHNHTQKKNPDSFIDPSFASSDSLKKAIQSHNFPGHACMHMTSNDEEIAMQSLPSSVVEEIRQQPSSSSRQRNGRSNGNVNGNDHDDEEIKGGGEGWSKKIQNGLGMLKSPIGRHSLSFFLFGTINNSIYVVILTAALELIPKGTPTGLVAFFNIFPALIAKAIWPYVLKGTVRYTKRIWSCVLMNFVGLLIIALLPSLWLRMAGIALASFSSGLGELTFLQLSTRFSTKGTGRAVGWFSSGTGAAGLVGASAWWIVRPLGVTGGLLSLTFLPVLMGFTYAFILPSVQSVDDAESDHKGLYAAIQADAYDADDDDEEVEEENAEEADSRDHIDEPSSANVPLAISPHASTFDRIHDQETIKNGDSAKKVRLSIHDKIQLIKPMMFVYIVPLVLVYFFEYTINQGVAPTLLYPLPNSTNHPLLSLIIKQLKDYYPFYQLTYQTFVFLSRSSISIFQLPAIPKRFLWIPAILQGFLLILLITESLFAWFRSSIASPLTIVLICVEGLAGGSAYVSVFYQIGTDNRGGDQDQHEQRSSLSLENEEGEEEDANFLEAKRAQEHEFRIGCVGVGDTMGILAASLFSMPLQLSLCDEQVQRGRDLCKQI